LATFCRGRVRLREKGQLHRRRRLPPPVRPCRVSERAERIPPPRGRKTWTASHAISRIFLALVAIGDREQRPSRQSSPHLRSGLSNLPSRRRNCPLLKPRDNLAYRRPRTVRFRGRLHRRLLVGRKHHSPRKTSAGKS
jgi:hypothetical protein